MTAIRSTPLQSSVPSTLRRRTLGALLGGTTAWAVRAFQNKGEGRQALLRHAAHALTPLVMARAGYFRHAVIVGASPAGLAVADRIERSRSTGKRLLGFFDDRQPERHARGGIECLGRIRELADYVHSHAVDVIYIALPNGRLYLIGFLNRITGQAFRCLLLIPWTFLS